ncbi:MAG: MoaD/ThiS family protein [Caldilinea sp.]|mgnify:CR=1 FL=1|nr:MoaD/ThiS family protein [Caldilinea sp.]MCB0058494.1 MoaD/ThiS family protein [Caldilineaceae bacterium]MCB0040560.1 MoaD/ThiS family protein [Caldilinea sp.]MCB0048718.1 MoaD/ThiS family protein [Caldilinea sp.]MCB0067704.1 MoaD/ThiS family protein [Caldilineaceae bacterium]
MHVSVRLSAALAQVTGSPRLQVEIDDDATVADLIQTLEQRYPALAPRLKHAVPIVGGNHATSQEPLTAGQEVAFLMPVAGGAFH